MEEEKGRFVLRRGRGIIVVGEATLSLDCLVSTGIHGESREGNAVRWRGFMLFGL